MTMQLNLARELERSIPCGTLTVWGRDWDVYVFGATRIERDWFLQLALVGPQVRTVTVRVGSAPDRAAAARYVVRELVGWLSAAGEHSELFIDCVGRGPAEHRLPPR
jgi:hypothetical protein